MSREAIARTLKRLRLRSGLTANQVGEKIGKSGKTVNSWENNRGQPDAETLILLCDIYGVEDILAEFRDAIREEKDPTDAGEVEEEYLIAARSKDGKQSVRRLTKKQYDVAKTVVESLELNEDENL